MTITPTPDIANPVFKGVSNSVGLIFGNVFGFIHIEPVYIFVVLGLILAYAIFFAYINFLR